MHFLGFDQRNRIKKRIKMITLIHQLKGALGSGDN